MIERDVIVFGCDEYALQLVSSLDGYCRNLKLFVMDKESIPSIRERGFDVALFDLSDDWEILKEYDPERLIAYCAVCDEAENIFLTISLHTTFRDITIFALATDRNNAAKLKAAGADKTIVTSQIAANTITEILEKPTASEMMMKILHDNSQLQVSQIVLSAGSKIAGMKIKDIDFEKNYDIIVIAVIDQDFQTKFTFTKKGNNHQLAAGDVMVAIGYEKNISEFEEAIESHMEADWHS